MQIDQRCLPEIFSYLKLSRPIIDIFVKKIRESSVFGGNALYLHPVDLRTYLNRVALHYYRDLLDNSIDSETRTSRVDIVFPKTSRRYSALPDRYMLFGLCIFLLSVFHRSRKRALRSYKTLSTGS